MNYTPYVVGSLNYLEVPPNLAHGFCGIDEAKSSISSIVIWQIHVIFVRM